MYLEFWGKEMRVDSSLSKELLGLNYHPCKESLNEMVYSMIDQGLIPDKRPKK